VKLILAVQEPSKWQSKVSPLMNLTDTV